MTLIGGGVSAARQSTKVNVTRQLIDKLDGVIRQQLATYDSANVPMPSLFPSGFTTKAEYRAWYIRRNLISADLPDRWGDVQLLASGTTVVTGTTRFPITALQRAHIAVLRSSVSVPTTEYGDAECLFMIVMRSGVADCVDCGALQNSSVGDVDNDSMPEFLDAWGNPIGFLLWPAGVQLPPGSTSTFFTPMNPFPGSAGPSPTPTLGMRPLIFSAGPDGKYSINVGSDSNLLPGNPPDEKNCGNPLDATVKTYGSLNADPLDSRGDNITNLDAEAKQ
jgi:hypothetical protein